MKFQSWIINACAALMLSMIVTGCSTRKAGSPNPYTGLMSNRGDVPPAYAETRQLPAAGSSVPLAPANTAKDDPLGIEAGEDFVISPEGGFAAPEAPVVEDETPAVKPPKSAEPAPKVSAPASAPTLAAGEVYVVQRGDVLSKIAARGGVSVADIMALNPGITSPSKIRVGQKLVMPASAKHIDSAPAAVTAPAAAPKSTKKSAGVVGGIPADGVYTVVSGDSLWVIARRYGLKSADIRAWNNLQSDKLQVGQKLILKGDAKLPAPAEKKAADVKPAAQPAPAAPVAETPAAPAAGEVQPAEVTPAPAEAAPVKEPLIKTVPFQVVEGDTLENIANTLETSVEAILQNNPQIKSNADLKEGITLNIPYSEM